MDANAKIYVAGHRGLVGSALVRALRGAGYENLILASHSELDLTDHKNGVKRLLFLGSSCIYPKLCPQPIKEEYLLTGPLEATNRSYALAKIAGIETCWAMNRQYKTGFLAVMPTNLYGPGDSYDPENSHVIPALIRKMAEATKQGSPEVEIWGSGEPRREFLHSDDMAEACLLLMCLPDEAFLPLVRDEQQAPIANIGSGSDLTIRELADLVTEVVGFAGKLVFDRSKPDGTPRKLLDVSRIERLGWKARIQLRDGLASVCKAFLCSMTESDLLSSKTCT